MTHNLLRIIDRDRLPFYFHGGLELMLLVRSFTDRYQELSGLPAAGPVDAMHVPQVAVGPLIERPREPDAGLNSRDMA